MTRSEFEVFLLGAIVLCAVLALVALTRVRSKGARAYVQAASGLAMGGTLWLLRIEAERPWIIAGFVTVFLLFFADFAIRSANEVPK